MLSQVPKESDSRITKTHSPSVIFSGNVERLIHRIRDIDLFAIGKHLRHEVGSVAD